MLDVQKPAQVQECLNWVGGEARRASGESRLVVSPYFGEPVARVSASTQADVCVAVEHAARAWSAWRTVPLRERCEPLQRFRSLLLEHSSALAHGVALESGKTPAEAKAGLLRGIEVIDFATALSGSDLGGALDVSRGVRCEYRRESLGVVVGITPFNFPAMVPLWMMPIAVATGNAFILKPSDKVPSTAGMLAQLAAQAGFPPGVFSVLHGGQATVEALVAHPEVQAVGFVGSTPIAQRVYAQAAQHGKRALCLGGAKNHLIITPDAERELTVQAVFDSFTGCAGQRCMAGSVAVLVGDCQWLLQGLVERAARCQVGRDLGALIDAAAYQRLCAALERAQAEGATLLIDGRKQRPPEAFAGGNWLGPSVLSGVTPGQDSACSELFGPILSVVAVNTLDEALQLEQRSPYGNATSVFTTRGGVARYVVENASVGMVGVNIGVPVPRDPFSFGGSKKSKFGQGDITGHSGVEFWTQQKKITSKWALQSDASWMS